MKEQYKTLWNWLLNKGTFVAGVIVNFFLATVFFIAMALLHLFLKWYDR